MNKRPILKLKLNTFDIVVEAMSCFSLGLLWLLVIFNYSSLPEIIPIHFNAAGKVDGYGNKSQLFALPLIGTVIFVAITTLNKFPHNFNYLVEITTENASRQYQSATRMLRILRFVVILIFITITLLTINTTFKNEKEINSWFVPALIAILFIITAFYIFKSVKKQTA